MNSQKFEESAPEKASAAFLKHLPRHARIILFSALCIALIWIAVALILKYIPYPEFDAFTALPCSTRIYDSSGELLQILPLEDGLRRERVTLSDIPDSVKDAFIYAEDKHFYAHGGVDITAIIRALYQNWVAHKTVSGGSTITMQLARLITPRTKRNLAAKCTEAWNALRLESRLSKAEILELYLNHITFGFNTEGVASAARTFFAKDLGALTAEEACLLAVIPRNPVMYSPLEHPARCAGAALPIYQELLKAHPAFPENTTVTSSSAKADSEKNALSSLTAAALQAQRFHYPYEMPHYIRYLAGLSDKNHDAALATDTDKASEADKATDAFKAGDFQTADADKAPSASQALGAVIGARFYTDSEVHLSASLQVQKLAESELSRMLDTYSQNRLSNGAVLAFDTQTGEIIAWVGSGDFSNDETEGQIDGVLTPNQPGSSMKPFLYALALDSGWSPAAVLPDVPHDFGAEELYIPQNFNNRFNGPVTLRVALASSLNVPAVWLLNKLGLNTYREKLRSLGFDSLASQDPGLSLALGGAEVTLLELTRAFSVFSRNGKLIPLRATAPDAFKADNPLTKAGASESTAGQEGVQLYDTNTARVIADILSDRQARALGFGYASVFETPFSAIFKTGTANQYQNITALASTPLYTVGVWMGNFSGETVIGKTGSSLPASIAKEILCFLQETEDAAFEKPEQYHLERICSLSGMKAGADCPNTRLEYLPSGSSAGVCTWHTEEGVVYPEEYQTWLSIKNRAGDIAYEGTPLTIETPRDGSVFFYDASALGRNQIISVSVSGGSTDTLFITLADAVSGNSISSGSINRPFTFTLPVEKGKYRLSVSTGMEDRSITFTVN